MLSRLLFVLLVCFLAHMNALPSWKENFRISINESGARYEEDVEMDMIKQQVKFHVPAHNTLRETETLHDLKNGHSITCYIQDKYCVLEDVKHINGYDMMSLKQGMEKLVRNGGGLSDKTTIKVMSFSKTDSTAMTDTSFLSIEAQAFLLGRLLYNSVPVNIPSDAILIPDVNSPVVVSRKKRSFGTETITSVQASKTEINGIPTLYCRIGVERVMTFRYTTEHCEHVEVCPFTSKTPCRDVHFLTINAPYRCECCEGSFAVKDCVCYRD